MHIDSTAMIREFSKRVRTSTAATRIKGNTRAKIVSGETEQVEDPRSYSSNLARDLLTLVTRNN